MDPLFDAVVEAGEEAILDSLVVNDTMVDRDGVTARACLTGRDLVGDAPLGHAAGSSALAGLFGGRRLGRRGRWARGRRAGDIIQAAAMAKATEAGRAMFAADAELDVRPGGAPRAAFRPIRRRRPDPG